MKPISSRAAPNEAHPPLYWVALDATKPRTKAETWPKPYNGDLDRNGGGEIGDKTVSKVAYLRYFSLLLCDLTPLYFVTEQVWSWFVSVRILSMFLSWRRKANKSVNIRILSMILLSFWLKKAAHNLECLGNLSWIVFLRLQYVGSWIY